MEQCSKGETMKEKGRQREGAGKNKESVMFAKMNV